MGLRLTLEKKGFTRVFHEATQIAYAPINSEDRGVGNPPPPPIDRCTTSRLPSDRKCLNSQL